MGYANRRRRHTLAIGFLYVIGRTFISHAIVLDNKTREPEYLAIVSNKKMP
jgi:hypothetical protein